MEQLAVAEHDRVVVGAEIQKRPVLLVVQVELLWQLLLQSVEELDDF